MKSGPLDTSGKPLSILLLGTQMAVGGAQRLLLDEAQWFQARDHKVVVAFFYDRDHLYEEWRKSSGFALYDLQAYDRGASSLRKLPLLLAGLWRLWRLLRRERFDAVITFTHDSNTLGLPLAWLAGVPVRVGTHLGEIRGITQWRQKLHTWLVNSGVIQVLVAASKGTRQNAIQAGVAESHIRVIPNGVRPFEIDLESRAAVRRQLGIAKNDIFILAIGRLVYEKGHEFLVQAMKSVIQEFPQAKVGICGEGPLRGFLEEQIRANGMDGHVNLLGQCDDITRLLAAADLFVLPSRWEGLSIALLEAMIAGLPIVSTRVEGIEEVIEDGVQGFLVSQESPAELANAILQLLRDPQTRQKMGERSRLQVFQNYTTEHMCAQYFNLIRNRLSG